MTLTEILIVTALLGLMATVTVPALPHPSATPAAEAAADSVASLLSAVRRRAIEHGITIDVFVDSATGHYWVRPRRTGADTTSEGVLAMPDGVTLGAPPRARYTFDPAGTASGDRITVFDDHGVAASVSVDTWTGEIIHGQTR